MLRTWDALGSYNAIPGEEDIIPVRHAICVLPAAAYRLLLDFLQRDATFCNHFVPIFHRQGRVSLYLGDASEPQSSEHIGARAIATREDRR